MKAMDIREGIEFEECSENKSKENVDKNIGIQSGGQEEPDQKYLNGIIKKGEQSSIDNEQ